MAKLESFETLQLLIEELTKDKPNQPRVRKLMLDSGLEYTSDAIQQMSTVLVLMSKMSPAEKRISRSSEKFDEKFTDKFKEKVSDL